MITVYPLGISACCFSFLLGDIYTFELTRIEARAAWNPFDELRAHEPDALLKACMCAHIMQDTETAQSHAVLKADARYAYRCVL